MEVLSLAAIGRRLGVTKESVRQWILKFESYFSSRPLSRRKERSVILLDETKAKRNGKIACVSTHLTGREIVFAKSYRSVSIVNHRHREAGPGVVQEEAAVHCRPPPTVGMRLRVAGCGLGAPDVQHQELHRTVVSDVQGEDQAILPQLRRQGGEQGNQEGRKVRPSVHSGTNRMRPHETLNGETPFSSSCRYQNNDG